MQKFHLYFLGEGLSIPHWSGGVKCTLHSRSRPGNVRQICLFGMTVAESKSPNEWGPRVGTLLRARAWTTEGADLTENLRIDSWQDRAC